MKNVKVSPSILSADFNDLRKEIKLIEEAGAEYLHFDVMDGHFVDNISFGIPVLKSIAHSHKMVNDVHIMISEPKRYAKRFLDAGADILTFHYEAVKNDEEVFEIIDIIHNAGKLAGISIKPNTPTDVVYKFLGELDLVLVMSVEPGFGGPEFMVNALNKISALRKYIDENELECLIEVDGGINEETGKACRDMGVDILVAGSYIFKAQDYKKQIEALRK